MSVTEFNAVDEFLGHSGGGGGRSRFLKNWKENGSIRIWLHVRRLPVAVWRHSVPTLRVFEDRDTRESKRVFWGQDYNCWESESFLKGQYKRDEEGYLDSGPPTRCSICRLIDYVCKEIAKGRLDITEDLFRFEGATDQRDDQVIHAGGFVGYFNDKLSDAEKAHVKRAKIRLDMAWRESGRPRLQYVLCVVNDDEVRDGVQIAPQPSSVGDKIKTVIRDRIHSMGDEAGNPQAHPYCIELTYDEREHMNKRYHARPYDRAKLTPEIERLITSDPPDLTQTLRPFNQAQLRAYLEKYAVKKLPWDEIFNVAELVAPGDDLEFPPKNEPRSNGGEPRPGGGSRRTMPADDPPNADVAMVPCDRCKVPMREDAAKCQSCGATYSFDDEPERPAKEPGRVTGDNIPFARR